MGCDNRRPTIGLKSSTCNPRDSLDAKSCIWNSLYVKEKYKRKGHHEVQTYLTRITEKAVAPHSSTLAWKIPWTEEPGRLQSVGSLRVGHDWATSLSLFTCMHWRRKWQPTPVFLPGDSQGSGEPGGLPSMGSHRLGHDSIDLAVVAAVAAAATRINNNSWEARACKPEKDFKNMRDCWSRSSEVSGHEDQKPPNSIPRDNPSDDFRRRGS